MACISVIMPARNAERTIVESIQSVLANPEVGELIVVNDGSTDRTAALATGFSDDRVRVVPGPEQGISAALNAGVEAANHPYIARCDSDDLFVPGRFVVQLAWLIDNLDYVGISGGFQTLTAKGATAADLASDGSPSEMTVRLKQGQAYTSFCTWLFRKSAWVAIGGARSWFETAEDIDVQFRFAFCGRVWHDPRVVYQYRLHDQSITHQSTDSRRKFYDRQASRFVLQRLERGTDDLDDGCPPVPPESSDGNMPPTSALSQAVGQSLGSAWRIYDRGDRIGGIQGAFRTIYIAPMDFRGWRSVCIMLVRLLKKKGFR